ncbi:MAG: class I SAM-dependent methyltransferase [Calditrichia bacterium]
MENEELSLINQATRISYDIVARKYHDLFKDEMARKKYDRKLLKQFATYFSRDSIICDMGCGPSAHIGRCLYDKGLNVNAVDISENCIRIASKYNPGMKFACMNMTDLGMGEQSIDGIISFYSIIHTPKKYIHRIFTEFFRVLTPRGKLLVAVKSGEQEGYLDEFLGFRTKIYFTHFIPEEIQTYFINNGFRILFQESRAPYQDEIAVSRIYMIGEKI